MQAVSHTHTHTTLFIFVKSIVTKLKIVLFGVLSQATSVDQSIGPEITERLKS